MNIWIATIIVIAYIIVLGWWLYVRFFKKQIQNVKFGKSSNAAQLAVEHNGQKIVIDYDNMRNKVLMEFTEGGMVFKVVDGLFHEPVSKTVEDHEVLMTAPEDDDLLIQEAIKRGNNISKL